MSRIIVRIEGVFETKKRLFLAAVRSRGDVRNIAPAWPLLLSRAGQAGIPTYNARSEPPARAGK